MPPRQRVPALTSAPGEGPSPEQLLRHGEVSVLGRIVSASNATLLVEVALDGAVARAVYKPVRGERPLWDFPHGTLADREVATHLVSEALGWGTVPLTVMREEAPFGRGSIQLWVEEREDDALVDVVAPDAVPEGWWTVLEAEGVAGEPVLLCHADVPGLRRTAVLDVVVNNADRKGGHVLHALDGGVRGVDHGLTFHVEDKLRTVLWGWAGEPLAGEDRVAVEQLLGRLGGALGDSLATHLRDEEVAATLERACALLESGEMPGPGGRWPAIPWPAF
ncbi:SCO1664 family protein [Aquipuribacter nitratireducens]|uniref:SCO1664 family protein n=1 Tax=Aquipuribacter nitratireducens TaxID=650104 RepID=A0ABW0GIZ6_9MICO